jgi:hypothetical protein
MLDDHHPKDPLHILAESLDRLGDKILTAAGLFHGSGSHAVTKQDLFSLGDKIMSAISDFATAQNAFNDQIDTAVTGLTGDVKNLNDQIAALQASNGAITPADQALLDGIQARAKTVADKLTALDALTPPVVPAA